MKRILSIIMVLALAVGACFSLSACGKLKELEKSRIVEISTTEQFMHFVENGFDERVETGEFLGSKVYATVEKYVLTADIDLSGVTDYQNTNMEQWSDPENVGNYEKKLGKTSASRKINLDGQGFALKNLTVTGEGFSSLFGRSESCNIRNLVVDAFKVDGEYHVGALFGRTSDALTLDNITLKNSTIGANGKMFVGGLVGSAEGATLKITNCKVESSTVGGAECEYAGGLIGSTVDMDELDLTGSEGGGTVVAARYAGGVLGYFEENHASVDENELNGISGVKSNAVVSATNYAGGVVGGLIFGDYNDLRVTDCSVSTPEGDGNRIVAANHGAGGIVGAVMWKGSAFRIPSGSRITFENCSSSATVYAGGKHAGGIVGWVGEYLWETHFIKCVNSGYVGSEENVGGIAGCVKDLILGSKKEILFEECSNGGTVVGAQDVGGILGDTDRMKILFKTCKNEPATAQNYIQVDKRGGGIASCYGVYEGCSNSMKVIVNATGNGDCGTVGGIVGEAHTATSFSDCSNSGDIVVSGNAPVIAVGGIAGTDSAPAYTNCSNTGELWGVSAVGGIVGNLTRSTGDFTLDGVSSTGNIRAIGQETTTADNYLNMTVVGGIGGLFGCMDKPSTGTVKLKNCTVNLTVFARRDIDFVGGVVGRVASIANEDLHDYIIIGDGVTVTPKLLFSAEVTSICKMNWRIGSGAGGCENPEVSVTEFNDNFTLIEGSYTD